MTYLEDLKKLEAQEASASRSKAHATIERLIRKAEEPPDKWADYRGHADQSIEPEAV
jgi:hypothetical protein